MVERPREALPRGGCAVAQRGNGAAALGEERGIGEAISGLKIFFLGDLIESS